MGTTYKAVIHRSFNLIKRFNSTSAATLNQLDSSKIDVREVNPNLLKDKPTVDQLAFGKIYTDHMFRVKWKSDIGWQTPMITPLEDFKMHPGAKVLHYAQELFEGMKAFRGDDDKIRLFRPMHNMARMNVTAKRACLPNFDSMEFLKCIRRLLQLEQEWVPHFPSSSLYIRPTLIGIEPTLGVAPSNEAELFVLLCPVGPYFSTGVKPVNLLADPKYVRAFPGGCGFAKMGCNYAPTLWTQTVAEKYDCSQCLWLYGENEEITEVGAMNIFIYLINENGEKELVTPPLDKGIILPGVSRRSIVELSQEKWADEFKTTEREITMFELIKGLEENRIIEVFGAGTAAIVSPVGGIYYKGQMRNIPTPDSKSSLSGRILKNMSDIYYGREPHPWAIDINDWNIDPKQVLKDYQQADSLMQA